MALLLAPVKVLLCGPPYVGHLHAHRCLRLPYTILAPTASQIFTESSCLQGSSQPKVAQVLLKMPWTKVDSVADADKPGATRSPVDVTLVYAHKGQCPVEPRW